jgi:PEP-CTERM motif-containing protein
MRYLVMALALAAFCVPAHADDYSFTITGAVQASGTITTGPDENLMLQVTPGTELVFAPITNIAGEYNGFQIVFNPNSEGLITLGNDPILSEFGNGMQFFAGDQYKIVHDDLPGPDGFSDPILDLTNQQNDVTGATTLTIVQTPEPGSFALLVIGLFGLILSRNGNYRHHNGQRS